MNRQRKVFKGLDAAIAKLVRMVEFGGAELVRDGRIQSALTELKKSRKGGQIQPERIVRAAVLILDAAYDSYLVDASDERAQAEQE